MYLIADEVLAGLLGVFGLGLILANILFEPFMSKDFHSNSVTILAPPYGSMHPDMLTKYLQRLSAAKRDRVR